LPKRLPTLRMVCSVYCWESALISILAQRTFPRNLAARRPQC
jgi:hypothetical protein